MSRFVGFLVVFGCITGWLGVFQIPEMTMVIFGVSRDLSHLVNIVIAGGLPLLSMALFVSFGAFLSPQGKEKVMYWPFVGLGGFWTGCTLLVAAIFIFTK